MSIKKMLTVLSVVLSLSLFADSAKLWSEFEEFANDRWNVETTAGGALNKEKARKQYFAEHFAGQQVTCTGTFKKYAKAMMGGYFASVEVNGITVKVFVRTSDREKVSAFTAGTEVTFTATFKSRGDLMHKATLEDGVFSIGTEAPTASEETKVEVTGDSDVWKSFCEFASDRWSIPSDGGGAVDRELARKKYFAENFAGKKVQLTGTFKKTGKAILGGQYVSLTVDGISVKVMIRPSEKSKAKSFSSGASVTFTGTFKSRGDLMHNVTFEDGVFQ